MNIFIYKHTHVPIEMYSVRSSLTNTVLRLSIETLAER